MLPPGERKGAIFSVRLSPDERARVEEAAKAKGLKASDWARQVVLREASGLPAPADVT